MFSGLYDMQYMTRIVQNTGKESGIRIAAKSLKWGRR